MSGSRARTPLLLADILGLGRLAKPLYFRPLARMKLLAVNHQVSAAIMAPFHTCMWKDLSEETGNLTGFRDSIYAFGGNSSHVA